MHDILCRKPLKVINAQDAINELPRSLSLFDLICIGIGGTIGSGIFATTGDIIAKSAGPAAAISWILGGVVCSVNAFAYMELTTRVPSPGSTYAYTYHAIGEFPAVIAAWLLTLEYGISGAGVARSWADIVESCFPVGTYHWVNMEYGSILGAAVQASSALILLIGVQCSKMFVNTFTVAKVGVVIFIIIAGFIAMQPEFLTPFVPERQIIDNSSFFGIQGILSGATQAFFGYVGFDEICCLAAEAKNPNRVMPIAVIGTILITTFLSVLASIVLSGMIDYHDATTFESGFVNVGWKWAGTIVTIGEIITMPVVVLVGFLAQPRLNYALACDGLFPQIFAKVDADGNMFWNTLITGIFLTLMAFAVPFSTLWDIVSFGILLSFILANSSLILVRTRSKSPNLAPALTYGIVLCSAFAAFVLHNGYEESQTSLYLVCFIASVVLVMVLNIIICFKCPQIARNTTCFWSPLVPFLPSVSILMDWYLIAQLSMTSILLGCAWIGLGAVFYFMYGFRNASSRSNWSDVLTSGANLESPGSLKSESLSHSYQKSEDKGTIKVLRKI
uniref:Amino AcidPolyamineOrganocation (APC) Family putati n=1 Tax=Albugo laibachii Nc14 TaxID=890382 RepID=F0W8U8_9STRA|nr:Amino AcidPolyamineOrganocation (APC) Family putati [Albugo laibachii Nc14]|eukprot:CCA17557.1 Amino AcidPolyamineOrganocation (APC) Family putati [Albugo laibachii Nc14]